MIGHTLSHYEIVGELGAGGMGTVYRARDTLLGRVVALKLLPADAMADEGRQRRFLQEARAASALNHPHIVTIHDVLHEDGAWAIVMELVDGVSLQRQLAGGPLPPAEVLALSRQIADALAAAHAAGIVHRDLKPANVMITGRGAAKVLDFGIAKLDPTRAGDTAETRTGALTAVGVVVGTVEYMSPEQARGEPVDARTDIFSLGIVCYEMLAGRSPFAAPTLTGVLHRLMHEEPPDPAAVSELPAGIVPVLRRMLAKDPGDRFQSMAAVMDAIDDVAAGREAVTEAVPVPAAARGSRVRRAWPAAALLALAATALAATLAWWPRAPAGDGGEPAAERPFVLPETASDANQLGASLLERYDREGHLDQSIESFRRALDLRPDYPAASAGLGLAYWRKYREQRDRMLLEHASSHAARAVELDPHLTLGLVAVAYIEAERGDFAAAERAVDEALVRDPRSPDALAARAHLRMQQRNLPAALEAVREARGLRGDDWSLALMEGVVLLSAGRAAEAIGPLEQAATLAPDSALVLRNLGAAYHGAERYDEATGSFQRALQIRPDPAVYNNLGTLFFFRGLYEQAVDAFTRAVTMRPNDFRTWSSLGDSYRFVPGRAADAAEAYASALRLLDQQLADAPDNLDLRTRRVGIVAKRGDCAEALPAVAALDLAKATAAERYRVAVAREVCGTRDEALAELQRAIDAGYPVDQVQNDPELERLRGDVRYHQFLAGRDSRR
jgi:eukaryotic-like serine/threonine-protein kinase